MSRMDTKIEMYLDRGGFMIAACDLCGLNKGHRLDMHELIARNQTQGNIEARELSFQKELCCLLDEHCHEEADTVKVQNILWANNQERYGDDFWKAFDRLQAVMSTPLVVYGNPRSE